MLKKIYKILLALWVIVVLSVTGYMVIEGWSFIEALYMTIITLTTVGFMEVQPLSIYGRIFTVFVILIGFSAIFYGFGVVTAFIVEGELLGILRRRKMDKAISKLENHYIICGSGIMGRHVIDEFAKTKKKFVVIEKSEEEINLLQERFNNILFIQGDAASDAVLLSAGIDKARGLITTFAKDKDNLFVVLTAKNINPDLRITARSNEEDSELKLETAGADAVVSVNAIGGLRMASEMLRPAVVSFLDVMLRAKDEVLRIEEAEIKEGSKIDGATIEETNILKDIGLIVIAVKNSETGQYVYNPPSSLKLKSGDILIILGRVEQVDKLRTYTAA
ncbi:potassium channel family protein [Elusimicrobiota bacterium]